MSLETLLPVVAIDGPVGVGKSSVARRVAESLGLLHLDTGAMYRAVAMKAMELPPGEREDEAVIGELARSLDLELQGGGRLLLDGKDVTVALRDESVSRYVSVVADCRSVREALVEQQRRLGAAQASVLEGRDIGTVVFPDAALKIFLDASPTVRVDRRMKQLLDLGRPADREAIYQGLVERDERDRAREWGALAIATDARLLDTTDFTEDMVVNLICAMVRESPIFYQSAKASQSS